MTATATRLANDQGVELFYYLKITGLPYYFFSAINPTSTAYGSAAWTLPSGYTAVQGMELPDDSITQSIGDIVGGIAEAEKIRVSLRDFQVSTSSGQAYFLSRLFAPGRQANSGPVPELETSIPSTFSTTDSFTVRNVPAGTFPSTDDIVHIGSEAILLDDTGTNDGGRVLCEIGARNKFPCAAGYPPIPFHRVVGAQGNVTSDPPVNIGVLGANIRVTAEPVTIIGRSAALYVGHMTPHGKPCTEAESLCRLIGRITSMDYGRTAGQYQLQIDSILSDLKDAAVAPGLANASIKPGQIVLTDRRWRRFVIKKEVIDDSDDYVSVGDHVFLIDNGSDNVYASALEVVNQVNNALQSVIASSGFWSDGLTPICSLDTAKGEHRVAFRLFGSRVSNVKTTYTIRNPAVSGATLDQGLLTALGFTSSEYSVGIEPATADAITADQPTLVAENLAPSVFIPYGSDDSPITLSLSERPISDAGDIFVDQGEGAAYVRLGNGDLMTVVDTDQEFNQISIGKQVFPGIFKAPSLRNKLSAGYYYAGEGEDATIDQVLVYPGDASSFGGAVDVGLVIGRLLASTEAGTFDATFNTLPDGAGLGWIDILDTDSLKKITTEAVQRVFVIDSATKFAEIFGVLAKEYGWILCWDPEQSKVSVRKIFVPSAPVAHAIALTESNRTQANDRTAQRVDQSNLRTAWTLKWGWDREQGKFMAPDVTLNDRYVMNSFAVGSKVEKIEDKSIVLGSSNSAATVIGELMRRSYFYRQPWLRCKRSMSKAGILLAPGSVHQIVDTTIVNPFTGAIGVTSADRIYAMLMSVTSNLATGECEVEFTINQQDPAGLFRWFSPVGLVDFAATSHGYNTSTGVLTMASRYASDGTSKDGIDFAVGDTVRLVPWDSPGSSATSTITAVASDGSTVTIASGLSALTVETLLVLQGYATATTARKTSVAFQGDFSGVIGGTTDQNNRWL